MTDPVIIKGNPTDEEVAAVVAALAALTNAPPPKSGRTPSRPDGWSAYWRTLRTPPHPSPTAWRTSLRGY